MYSSTAPSKFLKRKHKQVPRKARRKVRKVAKQITAAVMATARIKEYVNALSESTQTVYRCSSRPRDSFTVFGLKFDDSQWNESVRVPDGYELVIRKYFIVRQYQGSEKGDGTSQEIIVSTRKIVPEPILK